MFAVFFLWLLTIILYCSSRLREKAAFWADRRVEIFSFTPGRFLRVASATRTVEPIREKKKKKCLENNSNYFLWHGFSVKFVSSTLCRSSIIVIRNAFPVIEHGPRVSRAYGYATEFYPLQSQLNWLITRIICRLLSIILYER